MAKKLHRNTKQANLKRTQSSQQYIVIVYKVIESIGAVSNGVLQGKVSRKLIANWLNTQSIPPPRYKKKLGDANCDWPIWHKSQVGRLLKKAESLEIDVIAKDIRIDGSTLDEFIEVFFHQKTATNLSERMIGIMNRSTNPLIISIAKKASLLS